MKITRAFLFGVLLIVMFSGLPSCTNGTLNFIKKQSPHAAYTQKLTESGITETLAGQRWVRASQQVLKSPQAGGMPFSSVGFIKAKEIKALAWQFDAAKGTTITMEVKWQNQGKGQIFIDLFNMETGDDVLISTSTKDSLVEYEFKKTGTYIIRLQPELFAEGTYEFTLSRARTYAVFPVYGKNATAVQSFWGAPRGGGTRKHEGIDIFARKGTPVVAPVNGVVSSVRNRGLGGKQVWLRDSERGHSLYFAHLDSQTVAFGQVVAPGDTLGFVGNTGNAKFTPPHLHFGIYSGGAFDPYPFVENNFVEPAKSNLDVAEPVLVVSGAKANFRAGPGTEHPVINDYGRQAPFFVLGAIDDWYHIESADSIRGYMHSSLLTPPSPGALSMDSITVYNSLDMATDSMRISAKGFTSLSTFKEYSLVADTLQNFYYIRN